MRLAYEDKRDLYCILTSWMMKKLRCSITNGTGTSPTIRVRMSVMERERPPLIGDHTGVMDLEAGGGTGGGGRKVERHGTPAPLPSLERHIFLLIAFA